MTCYYNSVFCHFMIMCVGGGVKIVKPGVELEPKCSALLTYAVPDRLCDMQI